MKKSRIVIFLAAVVMCCGMLNMFFSHTAEDSTSGTNSHNQIVAIWISYYEYDFSNMSEQEFNTSTDSMFSSLKDEGINTVFFHVRAFADAIYKSDYFPYSEKILDDDGNPPDFDVLKGLIDTAHKYDIAFHAWINPYRISLSDKELPDRFNGTELQSLGENEKNAILQYEGGLYLNPASSGARRLILDGIREIIKNYEVDGIQFDDYFYPTTDSDFDKQSYEDYKSDGGKLSLSDWRRANVDLLVSEVYRTIKSENKSLLFGISPSGDIDGDYKWMYADVEKWMASSGFIDYICPQIYYGFENQAFPYKETADRWSEIKRDSSVKLFVGLASYKVGKVDEYAGNNDAQNEWVNNSDILQRQAEYCLTNNNYDGIAIFSYKNYFSDKNKEERSNLSNYIK